MREMWLTDICGVGCPSTESLKGVTKKEREQLRKSGGVVRIAYLTAVVPRLGENCGQTLGSREGAPVEVGEVRTPPPLPHDPDRTPPD